MGTYRTSRKKHIKQGSKTNKECSVQNPLLLVGAAMSVPEKKQPSNLKHFV
jgi:hypothetical protein